MKKKDIVAELCLYSRLVGDSRGRSNRLEAGSVAWKTEQAALESAGACLERTEKIAVERGVIKLKDCYAYTGEK